MKTKEEAKHKLKLRLEVAKAELIKIGVIDKPLIRFCRKFPEIPYNKARNYWYGKALNIDFIVKLEAFVEYCKNNY